MNRPTRSALGGLQELPAIDGDYLVTMLRALLDIPSPAGCAIRR